MRHVRERCFTKRSVIQISNLCLVRRSNRLESLSGFDSCAACVRRSLRFRWKVLIGSVAKRCSPFLQELQAQKRSSRLMQMVAFVASVMWTTCSARHGDWCVKPLRARWPYHSREKNWPDLRERSIRRDQVYSTVHILKARRRSLSFCAQPPVRAHKRAVLRRTSMVLSTQSKLKAQRFPSSAMIRLRDWTI